MHYYTNIHSLEIKGTDAIKFLQGQLTNDVKALNLENNTQLTALCNLKGRVIALVHLHYIAEDHLVMMLPVNLSETVLAHLKKYAIFSKVTFEISDHYHLYFDGKSHQVTDTLGTSSVNDIQMQMKNIEAKRSLIDANNSELFLPAELNLDDFNAVSYTKGCFMGQEVIARMKYKGTLKKQLIAYQLSGNLTNQEKLISETGETLGEMVNYCEQNGQSSALAIVKDTVVEQQKLSLENNITATKLA